MATLIPETLPLKASNCEREMAKLLRRLPEDWIVYHEPLVGGLRPDFVVLAPDLGVLVMEMKGWKLGTVLSVDGEYVVRAKGAQSPEVREKNPLRQVTDYWRAVAEQCQGNLFGQELLNKEEPWKGRLCFPVGTVVVFTGISSANVQRSEHRAAWEAIFTREDTVLSDERRSWDELDGEALVAVLKPFFRPFGMKRRFTAHQIDVLRWVLFPESRMDVILSRNPEDHGKVLEVLDARQEQHARSLGSGHRILSGVAGSGKTVLLLARARYLAKAHPEKRTLLLCFNKVLSEWLRARMADCPAVTVRYFDGWARELKLSRHYQEKDEGFGARILGEIQGRGELARVWDAVLIDEAQDFDPSWFRCALAAMKDPVNGDLVIVADGSQRLYQRRGFTWKSLGIQAQGKRSISAKYDLDRNYRNTPKIAALAHGFSDEEVNDDGIPARRVGPHTCRRANHSQPVLVEAGDHGAQVDAALEIVDRWLRGERSGRACPPLRPEDIGIFYPRLGGNEVLLGRLISGLSKLAPTRWLSDRKNAEAYRDVNEKAIKVQTVHSSKGLQYKAVIVLWTDLLPVEQEASQEERRQMYVAITRAENDLVLLGTGGGRFEERFREICAVRAFPFKAREDGLENVA